MTLRLPSRRVLLATAVLIVLAIVVYRYWLELVGLALLLWLAHRGRRALKREVRRQEHADPHQILERAFGNWTPAGT